MRNLNQANLINKANNARRHLQAHANGTRKLKPYWVARYLGHIYTNPPNHTRTINATLAMLSSLPRGAQSMPQFTGALLAVARNTAAQLTTRRAAVAKYAAHAHMHG